MLGILKNDFYRLISKKNAIIFSIVLTMVSIILGVVFTTKSDPKLSIGIFNQGKELMVTSDKIDITNLNEEPKYSDLVLGKYDCIVNIDSQNNVEAKTIKGEEFKKFILGTFKGEKMEYPIKSTVRGVGGNILGYLVMFILLQGSMYMFLLGEDLEKGNIKRVVVTPVTIYKYLLAHIISCYTLIIVPTITMLVIIKYGFGTDIGFSLIYYFGFLSLLAVIGIAISMIINTIVKINDSASMITSALVMLTSLLSGCFFALDKGGKIIDKLLWLLPQKNFMALVDYVDKGVGTNLLGSFIYLLIFAIFLLGLSMIKIKNDFILNGK